MYNSINFMEDGINWEINSIGGIGTNLYARWGEGCDNAILIDTGFIPEDKRIYSINNIFLTNTHKDHIQCLLQILSGRERICGKKDGIVIYVPSNTGNKVEKLINSFYDCDNCTSSHKVIELSIDNLKPIYVGEKKDIRISPFRTYHNIPSRGYKIEKYKKKIKENFKNLNPTEKNCIRKKGELYEYVWETIVGITGDTTFDTFMDNDNQWLKSVPTLITEMTFIDKGTSIYEATVKGHIHSVQFENIKFSNNIIVPYHFSAKYNKTQINKFKELWPVYQPKILL